LLKEYRVSKRKARSKDKKKTRSNRIVQFFRDARAEIRRVVWPTPQETRNLTFIVIVLSAFLGILMWLFDLAFSRGYQLLAGLVR
jgi:preprotein translocase subunit SecE